MGNSAEEIIFKRIKFFGSPKQVRMDSPKRVFEKFLRGQILCQSPHHDPNHGEVDERLRCFG